MQQALELINKLYQQWKGREAASVDILPKSGSERRYFRVHEQDGGTIIATLGANVQENETFIYFSRHFKKIGLPVPEILVTNEDGTIYLQQDFGNISLLNYLEKEGFSDHVYELFKKSLHELARLQVKAHEDMDYEYCLTNKEFGKEAIMADLLYFKYYFLDALRRPYDKQKLLNDFEALSNYLAHTEFKYFMFRDFQSRNIMVTPDDEVYFIDYQGGMQGAPQYDVANVMAGPGQFTRRVERKVTGRLYGFIWQTDQPTIKQSHVSHSIQWLCADPFITGFGRLWFSWIV